MAKYLDGTGLDYYHKGIKKIFATKEELNNKADSSALDNYVTNEALEEKGYLTSTAADGKYLGKTAKAESSKTADSVAWANVQSKPTIPTKTSELTNDSNFLTAVPAEYITDTELTAKKLYSAEKRIYCKC